jgi:hypothetical protein
MMVRWRAGATAVAATLLALSAPVTTPAAAQPIGKPVPPAAGSQEFARLQVTEVTPRIVTADTQSVTVTGRISNVGDRRIDDLRVRLQRGEAIDSDRAMRDVATLTTDVAIGPFQNVGKTLQRGDSVDVKLTIPVRNADRSLQIDEPGVYPLLVNVNGKPEYSEQARLSAVSVPLPVLAVPGGGPAASPKAAPPGVTMLWPLLDDQPRRLPTTDGSTLLADDDLADSLAIGGRLFGLVNSVRQATNGDTPLLRSLCFAVDPDLLQTVALMTEGYKVRLSSGQVVSGKGAEAASDWLTRVRDLTRGQCVLAVPYADADLVALSRSGAVDLAQLSLAGSSIVADLLAPVEPRKNLYWPAGGTFDQRTLIDLANVGPATVLADPGHLQQVEGTAPYLVNGVQTAYPVRALPFDSLVSEALASRARPGTQSLGDSTQNGMAALAYRAAFDQRGGGQVLLAPPRRWSASEAELDQFLTLTRQFFDEGFINPVPLDQAAEAPDGGTATSLAYTAEDSGQEVPTQITAEVMRINATKRDLLAAMVDDNTNTIDPNELLEPVQDGLLRAVSTAWRGRIAGAQESVDYVDGQLDGLRGLVVVRDTGRPLSLASGDSPIPVTIYNGLPVTVVVRINLSSTPGLRPDPFPDVQIPPLSSAPRYIPAEVSRSGRLTVDVRLTTPGGTPLGDTARLELNSTSYGIISVAVTGTAGVVLVLLVSFRIFRRVRAARAGEQKGSEEILSDTSGRRDT